MFFCQAQPVYFLVFLLLLMDAGHHPATPSLRHHLLCRELTVVLVWVLFVLRDSRWCFPVTPLTLRSRSGGCCQERLDVLEQHRPLLVPSRAAAFGRPGLRDQIL